jgi:hypothetical protein
VEERFKLILSSPSFPSSHKWWAAMQMRGGVIVVVNQLRPNFMAHHSSRIPIRQDIHTSQNPIHHLYSFASQSLPKTQQRSMLHQIPENKNTHASTSPSVASSLSSSPTSANFALKLPR